MDVEVVDVALMGVGVRIFRTGVILASGAIVFALCAPATAHAQTRPAAPPSPPPATATPQPRPVTGFVSTYAILRTARAAGFEPLAPPLRDGTIYVLRATDFRGILMRVVFDARTGAIRDTTRIVPADADAYEVSTPYGVPPYASPPPYAPPPYEPPVYDPYGAADEYDAPPPPMSPPGGVPLVAPALARPAAAHSSLPPLPHSRPAELLRQQPEKTGLTTGIATGLAKGPGGLAQSANVQARGGANPAGANGGAAAAPATAPTKTPPPIPLND